MEILRSKITPLSLFLITCFFTIHAVCSENNYTLNINDTITDGQILTSLNGTFQVEFFTPGNTDNRHLGIRYKDGVMQVFVWIANRDLPLRNTSGILQFLHPGILVLSSNDTGRVVWRSTAPSTPLKKPVAQILDSGNLVVRDSEDNRPENYVWQSFDNPTDTYLPGMKIGLNLETGTDTYLSSWKSDDDPGPGEFSLHLDPTGYPQMVVKKGEKEIVSRDVVSGEVRPSGPQDSTSKITLEMNNEEVSYREETESGSSLWRFRLNQYGVLERYAWSYQNKDWFPYPSTSGKNEGGMCDSYNRCGANMICKSATCECLERFISNGLQGCTRSAPLSCTTGLLTHEFLNYSSIKLPDSNNSWYSDRGLECREECLKNCSCVAYAEVDVGSDSRKRCLFYSGDLIDLSERGARHLLYIRVEPSETGNVGDESRKRDKGGHAVLIASLASSLGVVLLVMGLIGVILYVPRRKKNPDRTPKESAPILDNVISRRGSNDSELPFFDLSSILKATDYFSKDNVLGEGGFGAVYKGVLDDGEEIAVKRLSKSSAQGVEELKNEVILIAKLQHRNLVRLLGCCVEGEENMLVYEYMPNKSLNLTLFDETKSVLLDWRKRFNIINGIAKGLLYLHQDSRLRIIHRDLKTSNILLDHDMNPRISDFGLARNFAGNDNEVHTHRVVGTYGYMPPEYAGEGVFSVKSDVYSFGVIVLEIISGKRNRGLLSLGNYYLSLVGHAWKFQQDGNPLAIADAALGDAFDSSEVVRSIRVALLCVQKCPEDRPDMSSVVFMLGNEVEVGEAKEPGFYIERDAYGGSVTSSSSNPTTASQNDLTITNPYPR